MSLIYPAFNRFHIIIIASLLLALSGSISLHASDNPYPGRAFSPWLDTFAFCNETVWHYQDGHVVARTQADIAPHGNDAARRKDAGTGSHEAYSRRCFVMSRGVLQFWKFARFDPALSRVSEAEYRRIIRQVARKTVWRNASPPGERIVVPGFAGLRAFSQVHGALLRAHLGAGWPTYFRPGNFALPYRPSAADQRLLAARLREQLGGAKRGEPAVLWLANFPSLNINHAVVAYDVKPVRGKDARKGDLTLSIYDPNSTAVTPYGKPLRLYWDAAESVFRFDKTFYFKGGTVSVRHVFISPFH